MRINKYLSMALGISRRSADREISQKKVKINSKLAVLGDIVNEQEDKVYYQQRMLKINKNFVYYALNKPLGYISTTKDKFAHKKITDLLPKNPAVFPVGRLDKNSQGLMILTNDGDFANHLMHPQFKHLKKYIVEVAGANFDVNKIIHRLKRGVRLREGLAKFDDIQIVNINTHKARARFMVTLHQGWKRQIRRMFSNLKLEVILLKRIVIGDLDLKKLKIKPGEYKKITSQEVISPNKKSQ